MKIGIDVDGVLADFNKGFIEKVIKVTGEDLFPPRPFDIPCWDYPEFYGYTKAQTSKAWEDVKKDRLFWEDLSPYAETNSFLDWIAVMLPVWNVYFITNRMGIGVKDQTEQFLLNNGLAPDFPTVLLSAKKGICAHALDLDLYIDDKTENCEDVRMVNPKTACYMLAQPWNHEVEGVPRIKSLSEFMEAIESCAKK